MPDDEYVERIQAMLDVLTDVEDDLGRLADDVDRLLDTGLDPDDLVILLWGRDHERAKGTTRDALAALDTIGEKSTDEVLARLVHAYSDMTITEAVEFVEDLRRLEERYGGDDE